MQGYRSKWRFLSPGLAVLAMAAGSAALAQQPAKMMNRSATPEEWVEALKANPLGRTRSIVIHQQQPAEAPAPARTQAQAHEAPSAQALITFEFDSATLTPEAKQQLESLAAALASDALKKDRFRIEGHTDAVGSDAYNLDLSARRAQAVVEYLEALGPAGDGRLEPVGKGEGELYDKADPKAAINRRVVITNIGQ